MMRALRALIAAPQNNLKVFKDGVLMYGEGSCCDLPTILQNWFCGPLEPLEATDMPRLVDKLCFLVLEALTRDLTVRDVDTVTESDGDIALWEMLCCDPQRPTAVPPGCECNSHCRVSGLADRIPAALVAAVTPLLPGPPCDWNAQPLPADCILARILRVQRLEQTGSDRVYEAYRAMKRAHHLSGENAPLSEYGYMAGMLGAGAEAARGLSPSSSLFACHNS